jgi:hypothetical protein
VLHPGRVEGRAATATAFIAGVFSSPCAIIFSTRQKTTSLTGSEGDV